MATPKTYSAMLKHIEHLQAQAEALRVREAAGVIKRVQEAMQVYGISAEDLAGKPARKKPGPKPGSRKAQPKQARAKPRVAKKQQGPLAGRKRPVKYADSNGNTWAGGGYMPKWLQEYKDQGQDIEKFRVKKQA